MSERLVIDVIDNGGQWTHREWRMLRYLEVDTQIVPNGASLDDLRELDGLLLSGGAARVGITGELGNCAAFLDMDLPILGICAGHQFMARHYGGDCAEADSPEFGAMEITLVDGGGPMFEGTPDTQVVWESHNDEVTVVPEEFHVTAGSNSCRVQAMQNEVGDRFGLQFHPEVNDSEYGARIMENFVEICRNSKVS
uniref:GMP synthase, small subunit (GuaA) n=1 Tax=uncultured marine group II/III euryarchaeote KM3_185_F09 TaxID=1457950 RepID=A0A075GV06_9EURY|nr:GMP synthase, small subunit (guaA) [uncultured marine group II/III euryarchaeote KM3_185_F09]